MLLGFSREAESINIRHMRFYLAFDHRLRGWEVPSSCKPEVQENQWFSSSPTPSKLITEGVHMCKSSPKFKGPRLSTRSSLGSNNPNILKTGDNGPNSRRATFIILPSVQSLPQKTGGCPFELLRQNRGLQIQIPLISFMPSSQTHSKANVWPAI